MLSSSACARDPEQLLVTAISELNSGQPGAALQTLDRLVSEQPNFGLAQLLYGDLLAARAGRPFAGRDDFQVDAYAQEARLRWIPHEQTGAANQVPGPLVELGTSIRHALVVDLQRARLYLLENGPNGPRILRHLYASIGKNGAGKQVQDDGRTPVGIYRIVSYIAGPDLPDLYGTGAFPVDYPNAWDRRSGRTGYGIWVHGVPHDTYSRPPKSSEGCVAIANEDLESLKPFLIPGETVVVLSDDLQWIDRDQQARERAELRGEIERWRRAWESLDTDHYLSFYAEDFRFEGMDRMAFAEHKRRVNSHKKSIQVGLSDLSILKYPDQAELLLVEFEQDYRSDTYSSSGRKQLYWRRDREGWRIVQEISS